MKKRLVCYGDSFTEYKWSTWADLLAKVTEAELLNRAIRGCGNNFILHRLKWDIDNGIISHNDTIKIMWSLWPRVNKIIDHDNFKGATEHRTPEQQLLVFEKNIKIMQETEQILIENKFDYEFLSWLPLDNSPPVHSQYKPVDWNLVFKSKVQPSIFEIVYNSDWTSREDYAVTDENIPKPILKNLRRIADQSNLTLVQAIRSYDFIGNGNALIFFDIHSTPLHHYEYLSKIYPNLTWSPHLIEEINRENKQVLDTFYFYDGKNPS